MTSASAQRAPFGYGAIAFGAVALVLVVMHHFAGPFAPTQAVGTSIGDLAAEIREAGVRALRGEEQPVVTRPWDADRILALIAAMLAALAIVLGVVGFVVSEPKRVVIGGVALGTAAIVFQFLAWLALAIIGLMIVLAVIQALGIDLV